MSEIVKTVGELRIVMLPDRKSLGAAAANAMGAKMKEIISAKGGVRVVFASAASQMEFLENLILYPGIDWSKVTAFHQDEWVGVSIDKPYNFANFIKRNLYDKVSPGVVHNIDAMADVDAECARYTALLKEQPIDIICLGVGENAHIAFNEPHEADFNDPLFMKCITLDERCRIQQKNDFGFDSIDDVPKQGITMTIPALMGCENIYVIVPGPRKAEAIGNSLTKEISEKYPASVLRTSSAATLFLDRDSAGGFYGE